MSRIGFALLAIVAVACGLLVGAFNPDPARLDLLWLQLEWPLGLLLLSALSVGVLVGVTLVFLFQVWPLRLRLNRSEALRTESRDAGPDGPDA